MRELVILTFHGLGKPIRVVAASEKRFWISQDFFEAILDVAKDRRDVCITFDDSNASDFEIALPALKNRNMTAKFFVVVANLGKRGYLSLDRLRALDAAGMTIGNHGMHHVRWTSLGPDALFQELVESKRELELILGRSVKEASCPFGSYDGKVIRELVNLGYEKIYTTDEYPASVSSLMQPRFSVKQSHGLSEIERIVNGDFGFVNRTWGRIKMKVREWL